MHLSDIIWSKIGSYLPPHDLFNLTLACKRFGKKVLEIDGLILSDDNSELSIMGYTAGKLVRGHVDLWISSTFSQILIYYILYYNLHVNCTWSQCNCGSSYCGKTRSKIPGAFGSESVSWQRVLTVAL